MSEWKMKRFWKQAEAVETPDGFAVALDARRVKTPGKQDLLAPTRGLAEAIAMEWDACGEVINPDAMPLTRLTNSTLEKVVHQHGAIADLLAEYGSSDLLCYRATAPQALIDRQARAWDPLLDWAREAYGLEFVLQSGVMPVDQPSDTVARIGVLTHALEPFQMMAFHEMVSLSGSWVLGLAGIKNVHPPDDLWARSVVDDLFQEEQWGQDDEAIEAREVKRDAFCLAHRFIELCHEES